MPGKVAFATYGVLETKSERSPMYSQFEEIVTHNNTDDCVACRSQALVSNVLVPAVVAWETTAELPRFALALHGAAGLLGAMLADGVPRDEIDEAVSRLLDEIESQVAEQGGLGGPAHGSA